MAAESDTGTGGRNGTSGISAREQGCVRFQLCKVEGSVFAGWNVHRSRRAEYAQVPGGFQHRDKARGNQARPDLRQQLRAKGADEVQEIAPPRSVRPSASIRL